MSSHDQWHTCQAARLPGVQAVSRAYMENLMEKLCREGSMSFILKREKKGSARDYTYTASTADMPVMQLKATSRTIKAALEDASRRTKRDLRPDLLGYCQLHAGADAKEKVTKQAASQASTEGPNASCIFYTPNWPFPPPTAELAAACALVQLSACTRPCTLSVGAETQHSGQVNLQLEPESMEWQHPKGHGPKQPQLIAHFTQLAREGKQTLARTLRVVGLEALGTGWASQQRVAAAGSQSPPSTFDSPNFTCPVCLDDEVSVQDAFLVSACSHRLCRPCALRTVTFNIQNLQPQAPPPLPPPACKYCVMSQADMRLLLQPEELQQQQLARRRARKEQRAAAAAARAARRAGGETFAWLEERPAGAAGAAAGSGPGQPWQGQQAGAAARAGPQVLVLSEDDDEAWEEEEGEGEGEGEEEEEGEGEQAPSYEAYLRAEALRAAHSQGLFKLCPKCGEGVELEPQQVRLTCPSCRADQCISCGVDWHTGSTCEKYQEWQKENAGADQALQALREAGGFRCCPKCGTGITKADGCDHMVCTRCRCAFCYRCGVEKKGQQLRSHGCACMNGAAWAHDPRARAAIAAAGQAGRAGQAAGPSERLAPGVELAQAVHGQAQPQQPSPAPGSVTSADGGMGAAAV
ncbi:hypothetical protein V8C86DRAFT_3023611 [Haematococcus lacustris]